MDDSLASLMSGLKDRHPEVGKTGPSNNLGWGKMRSMLQLTIVKIAETGSWPIYDWIWKEQETASNTLETVGKAGDRWSDAVDFSRCRNE